VFRPFRGQKKRTGRVPAVGLLVGRADENGEDRQAKPLFEVSLSTRSRRILGDRQPCSLTAGLTSSSTQGSFLPGDALHGHGLKENLMRIQYLKP
jgi:hypothetical protein